MELKFFFSLGTQHLKVINQKQEEYVIQNILKHRLENRCKKIIAWKGQDLTFTGMWVQRMKKESY